jgi:ABC-type multidrug transport system permease subunit
VIGILAVELVPLLARVLGFFGGPFSPLGWIVAFIGWMIGYVVITVGLGASILTRLGTRPKEVSPAAATVAQTDADTGGKPAT